jgi:hypothetical protein
MLVIFLLACLLPLMRWAGGAAAVVLPDLVAVAVAVLITPPVALLFGAAGAVAVAIMALFILTVLQLWAELVERDQQALLQPGPRPAAGGAAAQPVGPAPVAKLLLQSSSKKGVN